MKKINPLEEILSSFLSKITMRDRIIHIIFLCSIFFIVLYPLYRQISLTPQGSFYVRLHRIHEDYYFDLSVIHQGRRQMYEIDQFTTEKSSGATIHLYYLLLGRIGQITGISDINMYWGGMLFPLVIYYIFSYLLTGLFVAGGWRWLTMFIIIFASPLPQWTVKLGNLNVPLGSAWWTSMDAYSRLTYLPHHFIAISLTVAAGYCFLRFLREKKPIQAVWCSIFTGTGIIFFAVPGIIFLVSAAITISLGIFRKNFRCDMKKLIWPALIVTVPALALLYVNFQITGLGYPWANFLKYEYGAYKKEIYPYLFFVFFASYGLMPFLALFSIPVFIKKPKKETIFLILMIVLPFLFYLLSMAGFLNGIPKIRFVYSTPYLYTAILGVWGIYKIRERGFFRGRGVQLYTAVLVVFAVNAVLGLNAYWLKQVNKKDILANIYIPASHQQALKYIEKNIPPYSEILSTYYAGVYLPAFTYTKVYIGHEVNTLDFPRKWWEASQFFAGKFTQAEAEDLVKKGGIKYIFWDQGKIPSSYLKFLTPVYVQGSVTIYKVNF